VAGDAQLSTLLSRIVGSPLRNAHQSSATPMTRRGSDGSKMPPIIKTVLRVPDIHLNPQVFDMFVRKGREKGLATDYTALTIQPPPTTSSPR
jgi:hypothetical protein